MFVMSVTLFCVCFFKDTKIEHRICIPASPVAEPYLQSEDKNFQVESKFLLILTLKLLASNARYFFKSEI